MSNVKATTVDEYIESFPADVQTVLVQLRTLIHQELPEVEESIRYNMPTFSKDGKYIIYFAAWKNHISLYPFTDQMAEMLPESKDYKTSGQGTIQLPLNKPLPIDLIRQIISIRLSENEAASNT